MVKWEINVFQSSFVQWNIIYLLIDKIYDFRESFMVRFIKNCLCTKNGNRFLRELIYQSMIYERVTKHFLCLSVMRCDCIVGDELFRRKRPILLYCFWRSAGYTRRIARNATRRKARCSQYSQTFPNSINHFLSRPFPS